MDERIQRLAARIKRLREIAAHADTAVSQQIALTADEMESLLEQLRQRVPAKKEPPKMSN